MTISPQSMFLQLYQAAGLPTSYTEKLLSATKSIEGSLMNLDKIFCYENHKVGVIYVVSGQHKDEKAILGNHFGSCRFSEFFLLDLAHCLT